MSSTVSVPKEAWDRAIGCHWKESHPTGKRTSEGDPVFEYNLCQSCADNGKKEPCLGAPCPSLQPHELTMEQTLHEFTAVTGFTKKEREIVDEILDEYCESIAKERFICMAKGCRFNSGRTEDAYGSEFAAAHSPSYLVSHIHAFLYEFVMVNSKNRSDLTCRIMSKLNKFLYLQKRVPGDYYEDNEESIKTFLRVSETKIMEELNKLKREGFWKKLGLSDPDDVYCSEEEAERKFTDCISHEWGIVVQFVGKDYWKIGEGNWEVDSYKCDGTLYLPPRVARMGVRGMRITGIGIGARCDNGQFEPFMLEGDGDDSNVLYGRIYPHG